MSGETLGGLFVLAFFCLGLVVAVYQLFGLAARRLKLRLQVRMEPAKLMAPPPPAWKALLCGTRLELGSTGFVITFNPDQRLQVCFQLYTPEGELVSFGPNLQGLKGLGEQLARDRAEFTPAQAAAERHWERMRGQAPRGAK